MVSDSHLLRQFQPDHPSLDSLVEPVRLSRRRPMGLGMRSRRERDTVRYLFPEHGVLLPNGEDVHVDRCPPHHLGQVPHVDGVRRRTSEPEDLCVCSVHD